LEQAAGGFFGEAGAVVAEAEGGEACVVGCGHDFNVETLFSGIGAGVFTGVVDEIEKDLFDRGDVDGQLRCGGGSVGVRDEYQVRLFGTGREARTVR
jgi:hypothetical protein